MKKVIIWFKGLVSAAITGAGSGLIGNFVDPETFNLETGLKSLATLSAIAAVGGVVNYVKQSPATSGWIRKMFNPKEL